MSGVSILAQTGQQGSSNSAPVVLSSDYVLPVVLASSVTSITVTPQKSGTTATTATAISTTAFTVIASNANRLGGSVFNDSISSTIYLAMGSSVTVSTQAFTLQVPVNAYFEIPYNYTGGLTGISTLSSGFARATEYTS